MVDPEAFELMKPYFCEKYGNPNSLHKFGSETHPALRTALDQLYTGLNAKDSDDIVVTSCATESNNWVVKGIYFDKIATGEKKRIVTTAVEHPAILATCKFLEKYGVDLTVLDVNSDGIVTPDQLRAVMDENVALVAIMSANNEIGTVQDIPYLAREAHRAGALFHTDMVQAAGKIPVDVALWGVDYATLSSHKIYGPKGIGALYVKKGCPLEPLIRGGHQEHGKRAGTYNTPAIAAFGFACEKAAEELHAYSTKTAALRNRLKDGLLKRIPKIKINGHPEHVLPNTLDVSFPGAEGEAILLHLDLLGISASTGSACASGSLEPSHVLMATGMGPELAHGSLRFSLGKYNTEKEVDYLLENFPPVIETLRKMSTLTEK